MSIHALGTRDTCSMLVLHLHARHGVAAARLINRFSAHPRAATGSLIARRPDLSGIEQRRWLDASVSRDGRRDALSMTELYFGA